MQKTRIKINNVLKNQLPNFVKEDYPLVEELFSEYYRGQEYQGGVLDILQNIDQYVKLNNLTNLVDKTKLTSDIVFADDTISVQSTDGFPDTYGLIQIDDEIILYKSKTRTSFLECARGFSGISSYEDGLTFEESVAEDHTENTIVKNLNILFLNEFLVKLKKQFAPGFENRQFFSETIVNSSNKEVTTKINENILIKQLKDFYSSKGTDASFKILFRALFNNEVEVIRPRDFLIRPSDAQYRVNKELVVEAIIGNPLDLVDTTIFQNPLTINGKDFISYAFGTVNKVETISRKEKTYYVVSLDFDYNKDINLKGSVYGEFVIGPKTIAVDSSLAQSTTITVDSTYGFPETNGILRVKFSDGLETSITYERKNLNQFLGCVGIDRDIPQGQEIYLDYYCEGGNTVDGDLNPIKFRVTGVLSEATTSDDSHYIVEGNRINIRTLGKDIQEAAFNNWKFNIAPSYKIKSISRENSLTNTYLITLYDEHVFCDGDSAKIISQRPQLLPGAVSSGLSEFVGTNILVNSEYSFTCIINFDLDTSLSYEVERKINKFNYTYNTQTFSNNNTYITDVQNVYRDSKGSLYVASQSLPTYDNEILSIKDETIILSTDFYIRQDEQQVTDKILNIGRHSFRTGDAIYYQSGEGDNNLYLTRDNSKLPEGVYYVKALGSADSSTEIKIASSRTNIDNDIFIDVSINPRIAKLSGTENKLFKSTNEIVFFQNNVKTVSPQAKFERVIAPKNLIRKISKPLDSKNKTLTAPGQTGILINGVEVLNYKSNDFIYYGSINDIKIKSPGTDYDVITPPPLTISDKSGSGASAICHVSGSLSRIDILDGGFDYENVPLIEIGGGNGNGAEVFPNMSTFEHSVSFSASVGGQISTSTSATNPNLIVFNKIHKFYDGEPVKYDYTQIPIEGLQRSVVYYVSSETNFSLKLYPTYEDSIKKTNPVNLLSYAPGFHNIISVEKKNTIGSINILRSGTGYSNKKTITSSENINIYSNTINIRNHGYETGEILTYATTGTPIVGLSTTLKYFVSKVDENNFKLCGINTLSPDEKFYLRTNQFIDLVGIGTGNHIFNYPPITVKVNGTFKNKNLNPTELEAKIAPAFRGSITSVFVENGGVGYGSSDVINNNRQPNIQIRNGSGAELRPIVSNGRISEVLIVNGGSDYNAIPQIEVIGSGTGAKLLPIITNGVIQEIKIVSSGINYNPNDTILNVISAGSGASFETSIQTWNVNEVERAISGRTILNNDVFLNDTRNEYNERITQVTHCYAPRKLRRSLILSRIEGGRVFYNRDLEFDGNEVEKLVSSTHSPIIGWAYDGNPIYGPFGYKNPDGTGGIIRMKSGYALNTSKANRPSLNTFARGFFVEDYDYLGNGDLDEYNGRFCSTPEFPNGTYAYFATFTEVDPKFSQRYLRPSFPYLIGNYYKSIPIEFNFDIDESQNSIVFEDTNLIRNTTPYRFISKTGSYNYVFNPIKYEEQLNKISRVESGIIDDITVVSGGQNYKVGDKIVLSEDEFNDKSYAEVSKIKGVNVSSISVNSQQINNIEFGSSRDLITIVGVCTEPHSLKDEDTINIIGLDEIFTNNKKNVQSKINVFTNELFLTENVPGGGTSGLVTTFKVSGNLNDYAIKPNDVYTIDGENIKVLSVNNDSSSIRVVRSVGIATYSAGTVLVENPRRFEVRKLDSSSYDIDDVIHPLNREIYFNPLDSIGIGTVGLTTSAFLNIVPLNYQVSIDTGAKVANTVQTKTGLIFNNPQNSSQFKIGDYVNLVGSTNFDFNLIQKARVLNVGIGSIIIDYDSSSLSGIGVTSFVTKWNIREIPLRSIYLPNHNLNSGDLISYHKNVGTPIGVSTNKILTNLLLEGESLYVHKFDDNHIGIAKTVVGLTTTGEYLNEETNEGLLYITSLGSGVYHSFKTNYDVQVGTVAKHVARVSSNKNSSLFFNENVDVVVKPNTNREIVIKYNKENRRLVVNPKTFTLLTPNPNNIIIINNHGFSTGDKVIFTTESSPPPPSVFVNNGIYFVVVIDPNTIKLSTSYYNATLPKPITIEIPDSFGDLSLVNPAINVYRNETIRFNLTDSSLSFINNEITYSAFKFNIYKDPEFVEQFTKTEEDTLFSVRKFGKIGIDNNAAVELRISDKTPAKLYYRLELDNTIYNVPQSQLQYIIDDENIDNNSTLSVLDSVYSGKHKVYNVTNNYFEYLLDRKPERNSYSNIEANISYITDSYSTTGEISEVKVLSRDRKYRVLPGITSVSSETGSGSILFPYSENIGSAKKVRIENIGFDYSSDYSLRPTGNLPQIVNVEPLSIFKEIQVTSIGKNYTTVPKLIVLDGLTLIQDKQVELKFVPEDSLVEIIQNSSGLYNKIPYIIPINNSNGVTAKSAPFNPESKLLTLNINASYVVNDLSELPFIENERVLLENFRVVKTFIDENGQTQNLENVRGLNSEDYGYALFEIFDVNFSVLGDITTISSVVIDLSSYLGEDEVPGDYAPLNSLGYLVPEKYFPKFDITLQKNNFIIGEEVITTSGYTGIVEYWDRENEFVSVLGDDKFVTGDRITGKTSNLSGVVGKIEFFDAEYSTNSFSVVQRGWDTRIGFLNDNIQRIHDSDYYQYFSYALKSKTQISEWNDPVSSLNHTAGFKKFGTLVVESLTPQPGITTISYSELNSVSDFFEIVDLNSYHDFDMVSENAYLLGNRIVSDQIIFNTREIQDYSESLGNRVLMIDDFSSEFNNLPRAERFAIVDKFPIYQNRHRKYFAYVKDKLFFNERQFSIISLIHDDSTGYVNQYGRLESVNELGTFDFVVAGDEGQVQFKPYDYEYNDFDVDLVAYSLFDTFVGLGSTTTNTYALGDIVRFTNNVSILPANSSDPVNITQIPVRYRSSKLIVTSNSKNGNYRDSTELNIIHDGINVYISEYGKLFTENINPPVGLATYSAYISGGNIIVDLVPYVGYASTVEINSLKIEVSDNNGATEGAFSQNNTRIESGFINIPATASPTTNLVHDYSAEYGGGYYYMSIQDATTFTYQALELVTLNTQLRVGIATTAEVFYTQFGSVITNDSVVGLGSFSTQIIGNRVYLYFTPLPDRNIDIRFYYNGLKTINDPDTPQSEVVLDLNEAQIVSFNSDYLGTENAIKRSFDLYHKKRPIMRRSFRANSSSSVDLIRDRIIIPNHYFSTGEEVIYDTAGDEPVGIATTTIAGIGLTDKLPDKLYIIKVNDISVRVAASASEALQPFPKYLDLNSYGIGSQHSLTGKRGNSRSLITIDNMIQSPIVSTSTTTRLAADVALKDVRVKVENPDAFIGGDIFKVNDEILRVRVVGFGSTNTLLVNRFWMGTLPGIHSTSDVCTKLQGNYNIVENKIHFYDAPYGKVPVVAENPRYDEVDYVGITTSSSFSGRIFNKSGLTNTSSATYSDNILLDDISEQFTGVTTAFDLKENDIPVSGISTSNLFVLIKDIFQIPNNELKTRGAFELGQNLSGTTTIVFNQKDTITNTSDINITNVPSGGIIVSVGSTFGGGYQTLKTAGGIAEVNSSGIITSISIGSTGSGYRVSGPKEILVSASSTVSAGTNIIPINEERGLFDKLQYADEIICNVGIGTSLHSVSVVSYDETLSTITISENTDISIPALTPISIKLNSLNAEIVDIGIRTESDTYYQNTYIGFTTVINGSISTSFSLINPGISYTSFYDKFQTKASISVSSGSTVFYLNQLDNITSNDFISINSSLLKIVGVGNTFVQTLTPYGSAVSAGSNILIRRYTPPEVVFDSPVGYSNIPLVYSSDSGSSGIGTEAKIKVIIGEDGSVIDFELENNGYGYKKLDVLTLPVGGKSGIPLDSSLPFQEFKLFVDRVYYTKFSAWSIGDLQVIDNFDDLFDNRRQIFPIRINGEARSIRARKGSTLDIQATLIVLFNDILQVPGEGYIFKGGSIIYFPEPPKVGDTVSIIFYRGNEEVDVIDVDVLETVEIGDGLRITSDQKRFDEIERIVTDIVSSDYANTNPYSDKGISQDFNFLRPVILSKQNVDLVIDGANVGKDRIYYEPTIYPSARIIQDVGLASTEIYVDSLKTFFDNDAENIIDKNKFIIKIVDQKEIRTAIATCELSPSGTITSIPVIDGGIGYTESPLVSIQRPLFAPGIAYSMSLTSFINELGISTSGLSSAILGEQIVGSESESIALVQTAIGDTSLYYVPLTPYNFIENEEVRFESSGLSAQIVSLDDLNGSVGIATIVNGAVTEIQVTNPGYGYTHGPIRSVTVISSGSGYPETLNASNRTFYNARLKTVTGNGINATADIVLEVDLITSDNNVTNYNVNCQIKNSGSMYSVGDILNIDTFDNIGVGLTNRNKTLSSPIVLQVSEITPPLVIVDPPTPDVEIIKEVNFKGDFGIIVGISTAIVGVSSNALIFDLYIPEDSYLRDANVIGDTVVGSAITISELETGDYFLVSNSTLGNGVQTLANDGTIIGIASDYINNVYQVYSNTISEKLVSASGIGTVYVNTVTVLVDSFNPDVLNIGIYTSRYGNYSWGKIGNLTTRTTPKEFKTYQDVSPGIESNPIVQRFNPLKYFGYST